MTAMLCLGELFEARVKVIKVPQRYKSRTYEWGFLLSSIEDKILKHMHIQ